MKTADAFWQFLPEGLDELFEMVKFEKTDQSYDTMLLREEKLSDEDFRNPNIVARGYTDYVTVRTIRWRGRPVFLHMRKNKWWTKKTNEIFSYNLGTAQRGEDTTQRRVRGFFKRRGGDEALSIKHIAQMLLRQRQIFCRTVSHRISGYTRMA